MVSERDASYRSGKRPGPSRSLLLLEGPSRDGPVTATRQPITRDGVVDSRRRTLKWNSEWSRSPKPNIHGSRPETVLRAASRNFCSVTDQFADPPRWPETVEVIERAVKRAQEVRPREGGSNLNLGYLYMNTQPRLLGLLHQHRDRPRAQPGAPIGARRAQTTSAPTSIPPATTAPHATRCPSARRQQSASAIDRKPRRLASGAASASSARTSTRGAH